MSFKTQVDAVIDNYGTNITRTPYTLTINDYGDASESAGTGESIKAVPYNYIALNGFFKSLGMVTEGSSYFIVKGDQMILSSDKLTYNTKVFKVQKVDEYSLGGTTLAKQVMCYEEV